MPRTAPGCAPSASNPPPAAAPAASPSTADAAGSGVAAAAGAATEELSALVTEACAPTTMLSASLGNPPGGCITASLPRGISRYLSNTSTGYTHVCYERAQRPHCPHRNSNCAQFISQPSPCSLLLILTSCCLSYCPVLAHTTIFKHDHTPTLECIYQSYTCRLPEVGAHKRVLHDCALGHQ